MTDQERIAAQAMLIDGLEKLLAAYRTGGRPSEATFRKIEKARAALASPSPATAEPTREGAPTPSWFPEDDPPINPGWYGVMRKDGTLCLRAFGNGEWWIPLRDGWLSGLPPGFKWCGPFEPVEWDTPRETSGRSPASGGEGTT